jgi:hypothetical protein
MAEWIKLGITSFITGIFGLTAIIINSRIELKKSDRTALSDNEKLASSIREELRRDLMACREEKRLLEEEVDEWRDKYYDLRDKKHPR